MTNLDHLVICYVIFSHIQSNLQYGVIVYGTAHSSKKVTSKLCNETKSNSYKNLKKTETSVTKIETVSHLNEKNETIFFAIY